jgi:hypothetical protein
MARRSVAGASVPHVENAARRALSSGNAVDAVVSGVLVAAAESPAVLLGPLQALVAGAGAGLCALDGRVRQPGLGAPRPRGLLSGESAPLAARVGVPVLPGAIASLLASLGRASFERVAGAAIERARRLSPERARLLQEIGRRGAAALGDEWVIGELTAAAGRAAHGLLTRRDLASTRPALVACEDERLGPRGLLTVPWEGIASMDGSFTEVVAAADARGMVAIACYEDRRDGLAIPQLGLVAPALAAPVKRGEPRTRPGEPISSAAPIALHVVRGIPDLAVGLAGAPRGDALLANLVRDLLEAPDAAEAAAESAGGRAVALLGVRDALRVIVGRKPSFGRG